MIKKYLIISMLGFALLLSGCATLFTGTYDTIDINSEPGGANIFIDGLDYGMTPATISVQRPGVLEKEVILKLDGYKDRVFILQKEFNWVSILNLGGFVGFGIDIISGAVTKYLDRPYNIKFDAPLRELYKVSDLKQDDKGRYILPESKDLVIVDEEMGVSLTFVR